MYLRKFGRNPSAGSEDSAQKEAIWTLTGSAPKTICHPSLWLGGHNNTETQESPQ